MMRLFKIESEKCSLRMRIFLWLLLLRQRSVIKISKRKLDKLWDEDKELGYILKKFTSK